MTLLHSEIIDDLVERVPVMRIEQGRCGAHANGLDLPAIGINLDRRPDRWSTLARRMSSIGFDKLMRASAIEGAHLPDRLVAGLIGYSNVALDRAPGDHLRLTRPAIGCFLSHLAIWRWMLDNDIERAIVFEDDAKPSPQFDPCRFADAVGGLGADKTLVFLGKIVMHGLAERPLGCGLARLFYFNGTFAYLITRDACRRLLPRLLPMRAHIDHQMSRLFLEQRDEFAAWHMEPSFFEPDWSLGSDCFAPLVDESAADVALRRDLEAARRLLQAEGWRLAHV